MSQYTSRLLISATVLILACGAFALCGGTTNAEIVNADDLNGEVIVIESKGGSSVAIERAKMRMIAGKAFIGGKTLRDPLFADTTAGAYIGGRVWVSVEEISRVVEYDTKARFTARSEISALLKREGNLRAELVELESRSKRVKSDEKGERDRDRLNEALEIVMKRISEIENSPSAGPTSN